MTTADILIIGGGMAGVSAGALLAAERRVVVIERETALGYHATGRSAAAFIAGYGNRSIRKLTRASRSFYDALPPGFSERPVLTPRGLMMIAGRDGEDALRREVADGSGLTPIDPAEAIGVVPRLRADWITAAALDPTAMDMDVDAILTGFRRMLLANGGTISCGVAVRSIERTEAAWRCETSDGAFEAPVVINAAGAWADQLAGLAGLDPLGLEPKKRTVAIVRPPEGVSVTTWPLVVEARETFYFRPEAGRLLVSPADESDVEPHDAAADELDIALGIHHFQEAVDFPVRRVEHSWAGLRTFAPDRTTIAGFDPDADGFFWLAGQGGYGIQTAPAMATLARSLIVEGRVGDALAAEGLTEKEVSPARLL